VATEGSVYQSKDKRWVAQYTDARGKVRYIYRKSKPEAKSALRDALRDRDAGIIAGITSASWTGSIYATATPFIVASS
jgi:hypothetical protein